MMYHGNSIKVILIVKGKKSIFHFKKIAENSEMDVIIKSKLYLI